MEQKKPPFSSFSFSMTDRTIGRRVLRMKYLADSDAYELFVESGKAADPETTFTRTVPRSVAESLRDTLAGLDAFNWEPEYGDTRAPGTRRWNMAIVFEQDVFSVQSLGGSDVPDGFDALLEALYQMDLPRPAVVGAPPVQNTMGVPDLGDLMKNMPEGGFDIQMLQQMQETLTMMQNDPAAFTAQIREEFKMLPREQQDAMLDMLAASGMGTRDWWERFLRPPY